MNAERTWRHRTASTGAVAVCAVVTAALMLTACSSAEPAGEITPSARAVSSTPAASAASSSPANADEAAAAAAETALHSYLSVLDKLKSDPQTSLDLAVTVAGGDELDQVRRQVSEQRARGERQTGTVTVLDVQPLSVDPQQPVTVQLMACVDVSDVDVLDASGASVVLSARPPQSQITATVVDRGERGWLVETVASQGQSCTGA